MPRKKIDHEREASMLRISAAMQNPQFAAAIDDLLKTAKQRGEESIFDSKYQEFDEARGWYIQYGLYYRLRDLCDTYDLFWPRDRLYMAQLLTEQRRRQEQPNEPEKTAAPLECPPPPHWQWWRMAQSGYGLVTHDGLTQQKIAKQAHVTPRTVMRAIDSCWQYLEQAANFRQIADLAGLDDTEGLILILFRELLSEQRKTQKATHVKKPPDK